MNTYNENKIREIVKAFYEQNPGCEIKLVAIIPEENNDEDDEDDEEEYNGSKDFPHNETDETCPICLEAYDRELGRLKDGIRNSTYESNCPHWCCCMCLDTMYKQNNDTYSCPICKRDITDWLKTHYDSDDEDDDDDCICVTDEDGNVTANKNCNEHNCCKVCSKCVQCKFNDVAWLCADCQKNIDDDGSTTSDEEDDENF